MVDGNRGGGDNNRAQADRWLVTSEELLSSGDFQGAKKFAIRACEADPSLADAVDYILAISDTLLAGESTVGDSKLPDWYAVLRLARLTRNPGHVATQYRRLALLLNPNVNRHPFADQALKLVSDAWCVLSDPPRKSIYDRELQFDQSHSQSEQFQRQQESRAEILENPMATSFWTACPYCFALFEYPKGYEECTLRCQQCRRAFEAVRTQTPAMEGNGEGFYFYSWAMIPLGFAYHAENSTWSPFSPLFPCPPPKSDQHANTKAPPRNYYNVNDDNDIYVVISDEEDDDGDDWINDAKRNKKAKVGKRKETCVKSNKKQGDEKVGSGRGSQNVERVIVAGCSSVSMSRDAMVMGSLSG